MESGFLNIIYMDLMLQSSDIFYDSTHQIDARFYVRAHTHTHTHVYFHSAVPVIKYTCDD
jgi:hypothetical protein